MYPVARWVQHCGDRACEAIGHLEEAGGLTRNAFRPMASIKHPDDFDTLALEFSQAGEDCKTTKFVKRTTALVRRRYWVWQLMHPEHPEDKIHPTRRVAPLLPPSLVRPSLRN